MLIAPSIVQLPPRDSFHCSVDYVACHISGNCYWVFGGGERRRIAMFCFYQVVDCAFVLYDRRYLVDAFVHSFIAYGLRPVQLPAFHVEWSNVSLMVIGMAPG